MIALLFTLLTIAMLLAWRDRLAAAYTLFAVSILLGSYWLYYHSVTPLSIQL